MIVLDTSVIVKVFRGNPEVIKQLKAYSDHYIPIISIGELFYGVHNSKYPNKHLKNLNSFIESSIILPVTTKSCSNYGIIKKDLREKGTPIPENDIWIAALAMEQNTPIITLDNHFSKITTISTIIPDK